MAEADALVLARTAGFFLRAPGFSHPAVPAVVRAGLAYVCAIAFARVHAVTLLLPGVTFAIALAGEVAVGATIGMAASLLYDGAYAGGRALDDYIGIRGSVPSAGISAGAGFGRLWSLSFVTAYFVLGGYRVALSAFGAGFETFPVGSLASVHAWYVFGTRLVGTVVRAALLVAGPSIATAFVVQVALGAIGRIAPRMSTFMLSFPLVLGAALVVTLLALPLVIPQAGAPWLDLSPLTLR